MWNDNEKKFIKDSIKEAVIEALTVEMTIEKVRDEKTGQPLAVKQVKTEKTFLPSFLAQILPYYEGALRGMQKDVEKNNNKIIGVDEKIQAVGDILIQTENSLKALAALSDHIKQLGFNEPKQIDYIEANINESNHS